MGKSGWRAAAPRSASARRRCAQSGVRPPGRRRGRSRARAAFADQGAVARQDAGGAALLVDVAPEVARGARLQVVFAAQPGERLGLVERAEAAHEGAERAPQLDGTARALAVPEGHAAGLAG